MFKKLFLVLLMSLPLSAYADTTTHGSFNFHGGSLPINSETTITVDGVSYSIGSLITDINQAMSTLSGIDAQIAQIETTSNTAFNVSTTASTNAQKSLNLANAAIPKSWIDVVSSSNITGVPSLNSSGFIHTPLDSSTIVNGNGTTLGGKTILNVLQAIDANTSNIKTIQENVSGINSTVVFKSQINQPSGVAGLNSDGAYSGLLENNARTGGSDTGTDISAAYADNLKNTLSTYLSTKTSRPRYIFFGGADNFYLAATDMSQLVSSGKVALYEHANGLSPLTPDQRQAIQNTWESTGSSIVTGGGNAMAEVGAFESSAGYAAYFGGSFPREANMNVTGSGSYIENGTTYTGFITDTDLSNFKTWADSYISRGTGNVAPVLTPNYFDSHAVALDFATDPYWAGGRSEALYGGALTLDVPPTYAFWQGDAYINFLGQEIRWGIANNLRVTLMFSPFNTKTAGAGIDDFFYSNSARLLARLQQIAPPPTSYIAQSYCGCTTANPLGGESLPGSVAQVALLLLNAPVSDPGTAAPQSTISGAASESKAFTSTNMLSTVGGIAHNQSYNVFPSDVKTPNYAGRLGDMAYQTSDNINIVSGNIGYTGGGSSSINVSLLAGSSFLTQVPLTFQGASSYGNQVLEGGNDNWLHLEDPYTTDKTKVGLAFGTDANAPIISRLSNSGGIQFSGNISYTGGINYGSEVLYSSYSTDRVAHPSLQGGTVDHFIHVLNGYTTDPTLVGFKFGTNSTATSFGSITGLANNAGLALQGQIIDFQGIPRIVNMTKADILATAGWDGMIVNDSDNHVPVIYENGKWINLVDLNSTYANLPTSPYTGEKVFCSDCYSSTRASSSTKVGVLVIYANNEWEDMLGNTILH